MFRIYKYLFPLLLSVLIAIEAAAQNNAWRDIYKVKKKDTIYGIAHAYGISVEELIEVNPEMKAPDFVLKKGDTVFIPQPKADKASPKASGLKSAGKISMGVMLPLHNNDGDGRRMAEYYRGLLIACDSLRHEGFNIDVYAWNVDINADIRTVLLDANARKTDIIFGPLYTKQVKPLADFCRKNDIKLVIPFSITADDVNTNDHVWQVYQSSEHLNIRAADAFISRFKDARPVVIRSGETSMGKTDFIARLTNELHAKGITPRAVALNASDTEFLAAFKANAANVVILDTAHSPELNLVFRRLNELMAAAPEMQVSIFGYTEWLMYESTYRELFNKYDTYIPSTFYYYKGITRVASFTSGYVSRFSETMQEQYLPRFALTGFDHAQFFLRGLQNSGVAFRGTAAESAYRPMQTPLRFSPAAESGGMINKAFQLVHYKRDGVIETISF
ncbi:MAG: LysM peptidoglycan-binding domain-containing protein [Prevotella sp.]|nr:LysM peptidoglycan-binding domain-containing protein [Prevotella sp.]